jgi:hypothetical protein
MLTRFASATAVALVLAILAAIVRLLWLIGSSPEILKRFVEASFLQAIAAVAGAVATIALVVVTRRLVIVTKRLETATEVQTHANTAPLLVCGGAIQHDPIEESDMKPEAAAYAFEEADRSDREFSAFLADATTAQADAESAPKRYLVIIGTNAQTTGSYAVAMDVEVDVALNFPTMAYVKTWVAGQYDDTQIHTMRRTVRFEAILGNWTHTVKAFRVDHLPAWGFVIEGVRYLNFRGRRCGFAMGNKSGIYDQARGLVVVSGKFDPLPGEIPQ